jgi:hypothetical protein
VAAGRKDVKSSSLCEVLLFLFALSAGESQKNVDHRWQITLPARGGNGSDDSTEPQRGWKTRGEIAGVSAPFEEILPSKKPNGSTLKSNSSVSDFKFVHSLSD